MSGFVGFSAPFRWVFFGPCPVLFACTPLFRVFFLRSGPFLRRLDMVSFARGLREAFGPGNTTHFNDNHDICQILFLSLFSISGFMCIHHLD